MKLIYAIPGLGTTKELFKNISIPNHQLRVLDWPEPKKEYTLTDYSNEFLKQIDCSKPVSFIGVSFGGMLCSDLAERLSVEKVVLISSCKDTSEFPVLLKLVKYFPIYKLLPDTLIRAVAKAKRKFLGFEKIFDPVFYKMTDSMPVNYFSYTISYIVNWNKNKSSINPIRIHGTNDKLLPIKKLQLCYSIKGGSHAMVLNNAEEINKILNKEFNGL